MRVSGGANDADELLASVPWSRCGLRHDAREMGWPLLLPLPRLLRQVLRGSTCDYKDIGTRYGADRSAWSLEAPHIH